MYQSLEGELAYKYKRISDDREGKELGIQRQDEDLDKLAEFLGVTIAGDFTDNDVSASTNTNERRPDYEDMMALLEAGPVRIVLSYTTSRLTRKPEETEHQIKIARKHGVQYYYVRGQALDLQVAANRRMARYQAANDAGEAEELQERVLRKKLQDAREGKWNGSTRTYGYGLKVGTDPRTGKDLLDYNALVDTEIAVLQECKQRVLGGESQMYIVKDLNARGIPTAKGHMWKVGPMRRALLYERYVIFDGTGHPEDCPCLRNPEGNGTRVHHEDRHRAVWPGIFTAEEHEMMATVFQATANRWSNVGLLKGRTYLLSGLTVCGGTWPDGRPCGGAMYGQGKTDGGKYIRRYACKKWDNHGIQVGCCRVFRIADPVELLVSEAVLERFDSPEVARALAPSDNEARVNELVQAVARHTRRKEELAAEHALEPLDGYRTMVATLKRLIDDANNELAALRSEKVKSLLLPKDGGLREIWKTASMEWRHSVIRLLVEKVVIHPGRPGQRRWPDKDGWNFLPESVEIVWLH